VRAGRAAAVAASLALLLAGCGNEALDSEKVESEIDQDLSSATAEIVSVSCPDDLKKEEGRELTCDVKLEGGGKAQVVVTQVDDRGNATYAFKPGTMQVSDATVEPVIEDSLAAKGASGVQLDCPDLMKVADGETATCDAAGEAGRTGTITFTWTDDAGSIDDSSVEPPPS
jgi:hypothetical protein